MHIFLHSKSSMRSFFKFAFTMDIIWAVVGVYLAYGAYLILRQERIVYQPTPQDFVSCAELASAEKITHGGTRMYFKDNGPRIAVLYHGNFGSACDRAFYAEIFSHAGYSYLIPEYAGYSNDEVAPSHERAKQNVEAVVDFLRTRNFDEVVVAGESLGDSFAAYHASLLSPQKLLLISAFKDFRAVAHAHFWYYPTSFFVENPFDNTALLNDFTGQVLLIHGNKDNIIPLSLAQNFFAELKTPLKEMTIIKGAGHNDMFAFPETYKAIEGLLK